MQTFNFFYKIYLDEVEEGELSIDCKNSDTAVECFKEGIENAYPIMKTDDAPTVVFTYEVGEKKPFKQFA